MSVVTSSCVYGAQHSVAFTTLNPHKISNPACLAGVLYHVKFYKTYATFPCKSINLLHVYLLYS